MADSARLLLGRVVSVCTASTHASVVVTVAQFELSTVISVSWTCSADAEPAWFESGCR